MLVVTTENIPGKKYEVLGEVFGVTTQSKNFVRNKGSIRISGTTFSYSLINNLMPLGSSV